MSPGMAAVTGCPGGSRFSMRQSFRVRGHDKKDNGSNNGCYRNRMEECGVDSSGSGYGLMARFR